MVAEEHVMSVAVVVAAHVVVELRLLPLLNLLLPLNLLPLLLRLNLLLLHPSMNPRLLDPSVPEEVLLPKRLPGLRDSLHD